MESDQSGDPFSDDYSTLSNVDISDLMAENNLIRQYVFRPNPSVNVTLNMVMVVVISVAVGLGIGHAIGEYIQCTLQVRLPCTSGTVLLYYHKILLLVLACDFTSKVSPPCMRDNFTVHVIINFFLNLFSKFPLKIER